VAGVAERPIVVGDQPALVRDHLAKRNFGVSEAKGGGVLKQLEHQRREVDAEVVGQVHVIAVEIGGYDGAATGIDARLIRGARQILARDVAALLEGWYERLGGDGWTRRSGCERGHQERRR
jgi:hypothetical protein